MAANCGRSHSNGAFVCCLWCCLMAVFVFCCPDDVAVSLLSLRVSRLQSAQAAGGDFEANSGVGCAQRDRSEPEHSLARQWPRLKFIGRRHFCRVWRSQIEARV